jgi:hypothetical protein
MEGDGLEVGFFVNVRGLEDVIRSVEDDERVAGDVCLVSHSN